MTESDEFLERIVATLKEPAPLDPGLARRVMAAVEQLPPPVALEPSTPARWWRRRWTVRVGPLGLATAAACLTMVAVGGHWLGRRGGVPPARALESGAGSVRPIQFVLVAPTAAQVAIVGDFNDWSVAATPLVRTGGDGVWSVTVPLSPGRYRYAFVVDGTVWRQDPAAPAAEDDFGRPNSVVTIGGS